MLMAFDRWKCGSATPSFPAHGISILSSPDTGRWKSFTQLSRSFMVRFFQNDLSNSVTKNRVFSVFGDRYSRRQSGSKDFKMPTILRTIVHDAIVYFLVIFTPHFVLEMTLLLAKVSISTLGDGRGAEISPAESPALASYISAGFNAYL